MMQESESMTGLVGGRGGHCRHEVGRIPPNHELDRMGEYEHRVGIGAVWIVTVVERADSANPTDRRNGRERRLKARRVIPVPVIAADGHLQRLAVVVVAVVMC